MPGWHSGPRTRQVLRFPPPCPSPLDPAGAPAPLACAASRLGSGKLFQSALRLALPTPLGCP
eukprot:10269438-Lingulodinium_polyedra.AAC.1